jgi:hypothetical protein
MFKQEIIHKLDSISKSYHDLCSLFFFPPLILSRKYTVKEAPQDQAVVWANATTKTLNTRSPLSLKVRGVVFGVTRVTMQQVVFKLLERGKHLDIKSSLELEYRIGL